MALYIDDTVAWQVATRTLSPRMQAAVLYSLGISGGPGSIVNSQYTNGSSRVETLSGLGGNAVFDAGVWATAPENPDKCDKEKEVLKPNPLDPEKKKIKGCAACPDPLQNTLAVYRTVRDRFGSLFVQTGADSDLFKQVNRLIGTTLINFTGMPLDQFGAHIVPQTLTTTVDKVGSCFSIQQNAALNAIKAEEVVNMPNCVYGSIKHTVSCELSAGGPEQFVYDNYYGQIESMKQIGQTISDFLKYIQYYVYKVENEELDDGEIDDTFKSLLDFLEACQENIYISQLELSVSDKAEALKTSLEALKVTIPGVNGAYGHDPQSYMSTLGVPFSAAQTLYNTRSSNGYSFNLGYELLHILDTPTNKKDNVEMLLNDYDGVLQLLTNVWQPLAPHVPTGYPAPYYKLTVDGRPEYNIDGAGQVQRLYAPPSVYDYKDVNLIKPSDAGVVQSA